MRQMVTKTIKWIAIPVLLIASLFAYCTSSYEVLLDCLICLGASTLIQGAIQLRQYFWACGLVAIAVAFTPLALIVKIFLLLGFACIAVFANLLAAFRPQPVRVG